MLKLDYNYVGSMIYEDIKYCKVYINKSNKNLKLNEKNRNAEDRRTGDKMFHRAEIMDFCGEYLKAGQVKAKSQPFYQLAEELSEYSKKWVR